MKEQDVARGNLHPPLTDGLLVQIQPFLPGRFKEHLIALEIQSGRCSFHPDLRLIPRRDAKLFRPIKDMHFLSQQKNTPAIHVLPFILL